MTHDVVLIPGDGIGPEITSAMRRVVDASGVDIAWNVVDAGAGVMDEYGTPLPEHVLDAIRSTKVAIKGPITTPVGTGFRSVNVALRREFDLYSCVRPCLSMPGDGSRYTDIDLVIVRENTEDLYAGIEFDEGAPEVVFSHSGLLHRVGLDVPLPARVANDLGKRGLDLECEPLTLDALADAIAARLGGKPAEPSACDMKGGER